MIEYYFADNEARLADAFSEANISITEPLKQYSAELTEYLATEYNSPMDYFLSMIDALHIYEAFADGIPCRELADNVIREAHNKSSLVLIYGDSKRR